MALCLSTRFTTVVRRATGFTAERCQDCGALVTDPGDTRDHEALTGTARLDGLNALYLAEARAQERRYGTVAVAYTDADGGPMPSYAS